MTHRPLPRWMFVAALGGTALVFGQFALRPALAEIASKKMQLVKMRGEIARADDFTRGLDDLSRYLHEFSIALDELDRLVPKETDADARVSEVTTIARALDLTVTSVRPDPAVPKNGITAHPLTIRLRGAYLAIEKFLYSVEGLERHSRVTRCQIDRADKTGTDPTVVAQIELTSFSLAGSKGGSQ